MLNKIILVTAILMMAVAVAWGDIPPYINFQGKLDPPPETTIIKVRFQMTADGYGSFPLAEDPNASADPDTGVFNAKIRIDDPEIFSFPNARITALWFDVNNDGTWDFPMSLSPPQPFDSVAYAFRARVAESLVGGAASPWERSGDDISYNAGNVTVGGGNLALPSGKLSIKSPAGTSVGLEINNSDGDAGAYGVGNQFGIVGFSSGVGVIGSGATYGGRFEGTNGIAVYGETKVNDSYSGYFLGGKGIYTDKDLVVLGRMAVGKDAPGVTLDVNGAINAKGRIYANPSGSDTALRGDATTQGTGVHAKGRRGVWAQSIADGGVAVWAETAASNARALLAESSNQSSPAVVANHKDDGPALDIPQGYINFSGAGPHPVGKATIAANMGEVTVQNEYVKENSIILLTPYGSTDNTDTTLAVASKSWNSVPPSFKIKRHNVTNLPLTVYYLILNVE